MDTLIFNQTHLSRLCLGTVQLGIPYGVANIHGQPCMQEAHTILKNALFHGINCFDTAQAYGTSEFILGEYHKTDPFVPMHIITKISSEQFSIDIEKTIAVSLDKLSSESLFALLLHDSKLLNQWSDNESSIVNKLKSENRLKYFGLSIYSDDEFAMALENQDVDIIQIPYNLFDRRAYQNGWFDRAKKANKLLFIRSVFLQGLFFMSEDKLPEKLKNVSPLLTTLERLSSQYDCSISELALSFVKSSSPDSIIILGCETNDQLLENVSLFNSVKSLDKTSLEQISNEIGNVSPNIYNPALWSR